MNHVTAASFQDEVEKIANVGQRIMSTFRKAPVKAHIAQPEAARSIKRLGMSSEMGAFGVGSKSYHARRAIEGKVRASDQSRWAKAMKNVSGDDPGKRQAARDEMKKLRREHSPVLRGIDRVKAKFAPSQPSVPMGTKAKLVGGGVGLGALGLVGAQQYANSQGPYRGY